jgi:cholesterol oxidase
VAWLLEEIPMIATHASAETVEAHYDAVIVGSGFGGSVMAYRLAEAGLRVCLLERGQPYPPGSFVRNPHQMRTNFWDPSEGLYGLFNIWSFKGIDVIVSSGLGGGSLIYSNMLIRKDERWFVQEDLHAGGYEHWPVSRAQLDPHYERAEKMLNAQRYPFEQSPYDQTPRTRAFKAAAEQLGLDWFLPNQAVTFANQGQPAVPGEPIHEAHPNLHGRTRSTCRLCGECNLGCNYGSKNSLDYTYLTEAQRLGAELRTLCEVRSFAPRDGGGYYVRYVQHDLARAGQPANTHDPAVLPSHLLHADQLIIAAGTLGSTFLMLKNRAAFPHISPRLGSRFGGNGDLLSFAVKSSDSSSGTRVPLAIDASYGPGISSAVRVPDALDGGQGRGFYIEDAGYPEFIDWMLQMVDIPSAVWGWRAVLKRRIKQWLRQDVKTDLSGTLAQLLDRTDLSAGMFPQLGIGRDIPDGTMFLRGERLDTDWHKGRSGPYFDRVRATMQSLAGALGAEFLDSPSWLASRLVTVHPLGGCPMGRDASEGVVDSYGEVFNYPGLYIADGSVMPGPVGTNPSLTIAALADRFADRIVDVAERARSV